MLARLVGVAILLARAGFFHDSLELAENLRLFPLAVRASHDAGGDVVIIAIVVAFGTEAVAGNAIGEALTQFNYMPIFAVHK